MVMDYLRAMHAQFEGVDRGDEEAVQAAETIDPGLAIPMHVGRGIGSQEAAQTFKENAPVDVVVLEME